MKRYLIVVISVVLTAMYAIPAKAADTVVGSIYDIAIMDGKNTALFIMTDTQDKQIITVNCETDYTTEAKRHQELKSR